MNEKEGIRKYNGWANYETWAVNLWLGNEESSQRHWARAAGVLSVDQLAEQLEDEVTDAAPDLGCTLYADLLNAALSEVDWLEIAEGILEDVAEQWPDEDTSCDDSPMPSTTPDGEPDKLPRGSEPEEDENPFGELIFAYTRAQAIADGVLVDVSETAKAAGFRIPVALTQAVFEEYVRVPEGVEAQDVEGRLWDVLSMCSHAIRGAKDQSEVIYSLHVRNDNRSGTPPLVELKAHCGPGDDAEPVITIMLPDED